VINVFTVEFICIGDAIALGSIIHELFPLMAMARLLTIGLACLLLCNDNSIKFGFWFRLSSVSMCLSFPLVNFLTLN